MSSRDAELNAAREDWINDQTSSVLLVLGLHVGFLNNRFVVALGVVDLRLAFIYRDPGLNSKLILYCNLINPNHG